MKQPSKTPQLIQWSEEFGKQYTDRNFMTPEGADALCQKNYGITRTELDREFLRQIPLGAKILEVGCNIGNQLLLLQRLGFSNLYGVDAQAYAVDLACSRTTGINLARASAFDLPYEDGEFDLVFTSGVLIHIAPGDLHRAMSEIHRCAKAYIWGFEYYSSSPTEVTYRGHSSLLWKMDYAQRHLEFFDDLTPVLGKRVAYLDNANVDTMFLLRKGPRPESS